MATRDGLVRELALELGSARVVETGAGGQVRVVERVEVRVDLVLAAVLVAHAPLHGVEHDAVRAVYVLLDLDGYARVVLVVVRLVEQQRQVLVRDQRGHERGRAGDGGRGAVYQVYVAVDEVLFGDAEMLQQLYGQRLLGPQVVFVHC